MNSEKVNILITTPVISSQVQEVFRKNNKDCVVWDNCKGVTQQSGLMEFLGFSGDEKTIIIFKSAGKTKGEILSYLLENYNKNNNGIMFELMGDERMKTTNKLLVTIATAPLGDEIALLIKESVQCGSTTFEARGLSKNSDQFMGMPINSNKQIVLSAMPSALVAAATKAIKEKYPDENVVIFTTGISDFHKLHTEEA